MQVYIIGESTVNTHSYIDTEGNAQGFDIESAKWIAKDQGFEVKFQPLAWNGLIPALNAGKIDMIYSGMTITEDRLLKVNFLVPYLQVDQGLRIQQ
jgi:polar amino acid transport system substrate-binding protein